MKEMAWHDRECSSGVLLFILLVLILMAYFPGRVGPFVADDYPNFLDNKGVLVDQLNIDELKGAWSANTSGPFKRPLASLSFALNYYFAGEHFDSLMFKLTNIGIHIINSFLVFFVSRALVSVVSPIYPALKLAFIAALIWALHPLQLTSVLYVVQRMTSLSCLFMLAGLLVFLKGRLQADKPGSIFLMVFGCVFGTVLGTLAKENALLLPLLIFVCELTLLPAIQPGAFRQKVFAYYIVTILLPLVLGLTYICIHPEFFLSGYLTRNFSFSERLMTEARALFYYLGLLLYPDGTQLSLAHDDFILSKGLFQPLSTLWSIIGVFTLFGLAIVNCSRRKVRFLNFAILWFLVGHSMESSIFPLELIYEHRNYIPSISIVIGVVVLIYEVLSKRISNSLLNLLYACVVISLGMATYARAAVWSNLDSFSYFEVRNHPSSVRANSAYANNLEIKRGPNAETYKHYLIASQLDVFEASTLIEMFNELNRLIYLQEKNKDSSDSFLPQHYDDPLVLDVRYMEALRSLVNQEILKRISYKSQPLRTMDSLRTAASCLINGNYECNTIAVNILEWIDAALAKPDFYDTAVMHLIRAKVLFNQGRTEQALDNVNKAISLSPDRMYFYAEKAYLHMTLNQFSQAEQAIREAESRGVANGFDATQFKKLRDIMDTKISAGQSQSP